MDLTFGIPIYNGEKYIEDLLNCFKKCDDLNYEILIVNDGSTDNSVEICKRYTELNIRIINQKNGGVSKARDAIIENTNSKWLTFVDVDDLIIFDSYVEAYKELLNGDYDFLINCEKEYDLHELIRTTIINIVNHITRLMT